MRNLKSKIDNLIGIFYIYRYHYRILTCKRIFLQYLQHFLDNCTHRYYPLGCSAQDCCIFNMYSNLCILSNLLYNLDTYFHLCMSLFNILSLSISFRLPNSTILILYQTDQEWDFLIHHIELAIRVDKKIDRSAF